MGEIIEVSVPDIGDFDEVDVIEVLVAAGDSVDADDPLITLESDKASMEVPSPQAGTVRELLVAAGDKVGQGAAILKLETADEDGAAGDEGEPDAESETAERDEPEEEARAENEPPTEKGAAKKGAAEKGAAEKGAAKKGAAEASPKTKQPERRSAEPAPAGARGPVDRDIDAEAFRRAHASPAVRRFARELGADLAKIEGSGRKGRIVKEDVEAYVRRALAGAAERPAAAAEGGALPAIPAVDFSKFGEIEEKPLSRIRKVSAKHLHRAWVNVPHVTQFDEADITEMEAFRQAQKEEASRRGVKLTPVAFLLKAVAAALREFPEFNSSLHPDGDQLIVKKYVHIGVAVDTDDGLVVPVIRDVDHKSLYQLAGELGEVSGRAREGKLTPRDIQGGCFSISSLGGIGGTAFTPIVNAPEVAILGVSRAQLKPVYEDGELVPRLMLPLSLSYDHRVIDGAAAARFIVHLSALLSDIRRLLL